MFRVNYKSPESLSPPERDFPRRAQSEEALAGGSQALAVAVFGYILTIFAIIVVIGTFAPTTVATTTSNFTHSPSR